MKNILLSVSLLFSTVAVNAQTGWVQNTTVREQNSNKKPLPNVYIHFDGAPAKFSGQDGKVRLTFSGKKPGAYTFLVELTKKGYELVNRKDFEKIKLSADDQLGQDIILAKTGMVDAAKKEYYNISDRSLKASFEKEIAKLRLELTDARLTAQQFAERAEQLQKDYDNKKKELEALAEKFARVNFDDVDSLYRESLEFFKAGKIDEAIANLESASPFKLIEQIISQEKLDAADQKKLDVRKRTTEKTKQSIIAQVKLLADMYGVKFNPAKAELLFDGLVRLDSTDLAILSDAAHFYRLNHRYEKALRLLAHIINHPQSENWQKANAHLDIGKMQVATGNLDTALIFFKQYNQLEKELLEAFPQNVDFKHGLAISYQYLGFTNSSLGNLDTALTFFEQFNGLEKVLYIAYPQNVDFKNSLAISYQHLGNTHASLGNLDTALTFFEQFNQLENELYVAYPQNVDFKNSLAISYQFLGSTYVSLGNLDTALTFFEQFNQLENELYLAYPQNVDFKNSLAASYQYLGFTHTSLGNLDTALTFSKQYNQLEKELYEAFPQNVSFKNGLASSYQFLGYAFYSLGNLDTALIFFEQYYQLEKELYEVFPQNVDFKNGLAISCSKLGEVHALLGNLDKGLTFFEQSNQLLKELYEDSPQNVDFKNSLAISYANLGVFNRLELKDKTKAIINLRKAETLSSALVRDSPKSPEFKQLLEMVRQILADMEADDPVLFLKIRIENEPDTLVKYQTYQILCDTLRAQTLRNSMQKPAFAEAINSRSWYGFFLQKFETVETEIREGLALNTGNKSLIARLAPALLLQGKNRAARKEYKKWKDQPFGEQGYLTYREAFLNDLNVFEKAGIIPLERKGNVEEIRNILKKKNK